MATDDYKHDGQVTITLAYDADEISVWPSVEVAGGVTIALLDSQEPRTNVGIASPDEWDAFVAAGNAALGRPAPTSTPLEERIANAATDALAGFGKDTDKDDWTWANGCEAGLRAAIYARYATDLQNAKSIEDQFALCRCGYFPSQNSCCMFWCSAPQPPRHEVTFWFVQPRGACIDEVKTEFLNDGEPAWAACWICAAGTGCSCSAASPV